MKNMFSKEMLKKSAIFRKAVAVVSALAIVLGVVLNAIPAAGITASAAAKDPVKITLYDSSTAPAGDDCGSSGKTYSVSAAQLSSWRVDADGLSSCYVIVTYAEAPTSGVIGINANNASGLVDWNANFSYVDNISGTTTSTIALSSVGDKAATVIANGLTVQVKSAYVSKIDFNTGSSSENIFTYTAGNISEIEFNAAAMAALEGASGISAQIIGTGSGWGFFTEMSSWSSTDGGNPATLTSENEKWDTFAAASGIKITFGGFDSISKVVLTVTYPTNAGDGIEINETNFPDENFRKYVSDECDTDKNGYLSSNEIKLVKSIMVDVKSISDMTGIEYFTELSFLNCANNQLTSLDISKNTKLQAFYCFNNNLTSLDVSKSTALTILDCHGNQLTSLDVSKNTALISLDCGQNKLTSLDVSQNTALTSLDCSNNLRVVDTCVFDPATLTNGFELSKASNWTNAEITNDNKIFYLGTGNVTYTYDCGKNQSATFTLVFPSRSLTKVDKKDATCTEDGNIEYYKCSCGCKFKSENPAAADILSDEDVVTAATGHEFADIWKITKKPTLTTTGTAERTCTKDSTHKDTKELPVLTDTTVWMKDETRHVEPTDEEEGMDTYLSEYGDVEIVLPKKEHTHSLVKTEAQDATCTTDGNEAYWTCSGCDKMFSDENGTTKISAIPTLPALGHNPAATWTSSADGHWHACSGCEDKLDLSAHTSDSGTVTKAPTETETGIRTFKCTVCKYVIRTENIDKLSPSHTHSYGTDWKSNEDGHWHECDCGDKSDSAAHTEDGGTVTKAPTETETGIKTYKCSVCGYVLKTEVIPATGSGNTSRPDDTSKPDSVGNISKDTQVGENVLNAELVTPTEALAEATLTPEELESVKNGENIKIVLRLEDGKAVVSDEDKAAVEAALNGSENLKPAQYLEINLYKILGGVETRITQTNKPVAIKITVPEEFRGSGREFMLVRVHDGETALLPDTDNDESTVTVETDRFSTYALVYKENASANNPGGNPNTGVSQMGMCFIVTGSVMLFIILFLTLFTGRNGMSAERKERVFTSLIAWGKKGGRIRALIALTAIFLLLSFYYGIGMKTAEK